MPLLAAPHYLELGNALAERNRRLLTIGDAVSVLLQAPRETARAVAPLPFSPTRAQRPANCGAWSASARLVLTSLVLGLLITAGLSIDFWMEQRRQPDTLDPLQTRSQTDALVERIIAVESHNRVQANNRSTADGPAQFLAGTWVELLRAFRPDLAAGHTRAELLSLRRDPILAREMTRFLLQQNGRLLSRRRLPVTAWTLYMAHFAGGAGAAAILSAPKSADAALVLARADVTGALTRDKVVKANPFLEHYSVADLQRWAKAKVGEPSAAPWLVRIWRSWHA